MKGTVAPSSRRSMAAVICAALAASSVASIWVMFMGFLLILLGEIGRLIALQMNETAQAAVKHHHIEDELQVTKLR